MRKASVKEMSGKNKLDYVKDIFVSLVGGYGLTFLGIVILAFLLLMFQQLHSVSLSAQSNFHSQVKTRQLFSFFNFQFFLHFFKNSELWQILLS